MRLPAAAEALLALPPGRFVAERDALAKALAARGDAGAEPVRRLRRPVGMSWMMNRLARERPEGVEALLAAGERLRTGQRRALAGQGSIDLRAAERELREGARALRLAAEPVAAERGRAATPAELARLELLLRIAGSAPGPVREALRRGVLEREPELATPDLSGLAILAGAGAPERRAGRSGAQVGAAKRRRGERTKRDGTGEGRAGREPEVELARRERAARERAARERQARAAAARRELARAEARAERVASAASAAEARARAARSRADAANAEVARRREAVAALEREA
jgi:hypothetical protein